MYVFIYKKKTLFMTYKTHRDEQNKQYFVSKKINSLIYHLAYASSALVKCDLHIVLFIMLSISRCAIVANLYFVV